MGPQVQVHPLTPERWDDFVRLLGPSGVGGCWCMYFRLPGKQWSEQCRDKGEANRAALKAIVDEGRVPGLLAYLGDEVVGWVSVAPRQEFGRVERSRTTKPVDDAPVWSVVCFYIDRHHRGQGVASALLEGAVDHVRSQGGRLVEAYPVDDTATRFDNSAAYYGLLSMFTRAGFDEVARRSPRRPVVRRTVRPKRRT